MTETTRKGLYGQRPSRSADEARRASFERLRRLDPLARIALALSLGRRAKRVRAARTG